ncbi:hypothetical protein SAMN04487969_108194 [Paenibacillus algorifonticola]|uniref:Uncharacterized protein n=1 Tax=Paenibacillus algorifonticola TaxID=684063 RepID=A0A1I2E5W8_9BACL|nr:hypothetical protein SAMN04487969_108194 [Paenibacillus algorifonticola]
MLKEIEVYVNRLYQHAVGNKKEIKELKDEMCSHLMEAVHELKQEGKSEQEAVHLAIERFGGEAELQLVIGQLFQAQRIFAKRVLYTAIFFLVASLLTIFIIWVDELGNNNENRAIAERISDLLGTQSSITADQQEHIKQLAQSAGQIASIKVYKLDKVERDNGEYTSFNSEGVIPDYQYDTSVPIFEWMDYYYSLDQEWFIHIKSRHFSGMFDAVLVGGLTAYIVLFTIWAIINAYHHRRLNTGWIIVFTLFNAVGYIAYHLIRRKARLNAAG